VVVVASDGLYTQAGATLGLWRECTSTGQGGKTCTKISLRDCRVNGVDVGYARSCHELKGMRACGVLEAIFGGLTAVCLLATFRWPAIKNLRATGLVMGGLSALFGIVFMALMVNYRLSAFDTVPRYGYGFSLLVVAWILMSLGCAVFWHATRVAAGSSGGAATGGTAGGDSSDRGRLGSSTGGVAYTGGGGAIAGDENTSEHARLGPESDSSDRT